MARRTADPGRRRPACSAPSGRPRCWRYWRCSREGQAVMEVVRTRDEFEVGPRRTRRVDRPRADDGRVACRPRGAAVRAARADCASVVTTNFVNPLQFGPGEDLGRYPRTLAADLAVCDREGVDLVWAPGVEDVYPYGGSSTTVHPGRARRRARGRRPTRSLRRRPHRGCEVPRTGPPRRGLLRREGLSAAGPDPATRARSRAARGHRRGAYRARTRRPRAVEPQRLPLGGATAVTRSPLSRALRIGAAAAGEGALGVITAATAVLAAEDAVAVDYSGTA